jgi:hypothetical protein
MSIRNFKNIFFVNKNKENNILKTFMKDLIKEWSKKYLILEG